MGIHESSQKIEDWRLYWAAEWVRCERRRRDALDQVRELQPPVSEAAWRGAREWMRQIEMTLGEKARYARDRLTMALQEEPYFDNVIQMVNRQSFELETMRREYWGKVAHRAIS